MKKDGIQTRNRKISSKLKKSIRDPRLDFPFGFGRPGFPHPIINNHLNLQMGAGLGLPPFNPLMYAPNTTNTMNLGLLGSTLPNTFNALNQANQNLNLNNTNFNFNQNLFPTYNANFAQNNNLVNKLAEQASNQAQQQQGTTSSLENVQGSSSQTQNENESGGQLDLSGLQQASGWSGN